MDCDALLNPEENSHEAVVLLMTYFYIAMLNDKESKEEIVDKFHYAVLPIIRDAWKKMFGYGALPETTTSFPDIQLFNDSCACFIDELEETDNLEGMLEHMCAKITNDEIQFLCICIFSVLAWSDDKFTKAEAIMIENIMECWPETTDYFSNNESKQKEVSEKYKVFQLNGESYANLNRQRVMAGGKATTDSSCFIATAVLGEEHLALLPLREYRDTVLKKNVIGKKFVCWYYENGPYLAKVVGRNQIFKFFVKHFFVLPISWVIALLYR